MQSVFLIVHVLVAVGLIGLVMLQHGKGADAGAAFGSGASGSLFGSRGPATFLTRGTAVLAAVFFVTSLSLGYMAGKSVDRRSVTDRVPLQTQQISETTREAVESVPEDDIVPDEPESSGSGSTAGPETSEVPKAPE